MQLDDSGARAHAAAALTFVALRVDGVTTGAVAGPKHRVRTRTPRLPPEKAFRNLVVLCSLPNNKLARLFF